MRASGTAIEIRGRRLIADASGALVWPEYDLLVVADLHLEKGSAWATRGQLLPPYDTRSTLALLERLVGEIRPRRVISLGDGFHDLEGAGRLAGSDRERLARLIAAQEWIWVLGNHDPAPPDGLGGIGEAAVEVAGLQFRHEPAAGPVQGEVAGHLHPAARLHRRGRSVRRACFVGDGERVVLPAFGAFTGGLDVRDHAIRRLFALPPSAWLLGRRTVHRLAVERLDG